MDGVIVDTEGVYHKPLLQYVQQFNPSAVSEDLNAVIGRGKKDVWEIVASVAGTGKTGQEVMEDYNRNWRPLHAPEPDYTALFRPAVRNILHTAKQKSIKTAVASSTAYEKVVRILKAVGIFDEMDYVVSGEDLERPKPAPDIYLKAAETLQILPRDCAVIEDSTAGIEAAHAAGMRVYALIDNRFGFDRSKADFELEKLDDFPALMENEAAEKVIKFNCHIMY